MFEIDFDKGKKFGSEKPVFEKVQMDFPVKVEVLVQLRSSRQIF